MPWTGARSDTLVDASLLLRYQYSDNDELQLGLARKNRAPNLYERYSWGVSTMAASMIGWFGDGKRLHWQPRSRRRDCTYYQCALY